MSDTTDAPLDSGDIFVRFVPKEDEPTFDDLIAIHDNLALAREARREIARGEPTPSCSAEAAAEIMREAEATLANLTLRTALEADTGEPAALWPEDMNLWARLLGLGIGMITARQYERKGDHAKADVLRRAAAERFCEIGAVLSEETREGGE